MSGIVQALAGIALGPVGAIALGTVALVSTVIYATNKKKLMEENLRRIRQFTGSQKTENEIIEVLCSQCKDFEKVDSLVSVTRMLDKFEKEIPKYIRFHKNKAKVTEILFSCCRSIEVRIRMLKRLVTTEKEMMEELRRCEEEVGRYAISPLTAVEIVDALCFGKEDTEERLDCVQPIAEALWKWEVGNSEVLKFESRKKENI